MAFGAPPSRRTVAALSDAIAYHPGRRDVPQAVGAVPR